MKSANLLTVALMTLLPWTCVFAQPLIETTTVSLVVPGSPAIYGTGDSPSLHVFAADAQPRSETGGLQGLAEAGGELSNLEQQRRQLGWRGAIGPR